MSMYSYGITTRSRKRKMNEYAGNIAKRPRHFTPDSSSISLLTDHCTPSAQSPPHLYQTPQQSPLSTPESSDVEHEDDVCSDTLTSLISSHLETRCLASPHASPMRHHKFYCQFPQPFSLHFYINRLVQYSSCSSSAFILMLIYLDRIETNCDITISNVNCHRLISTALLLAIKYLDDHVFSNAYYARVAGLTCNEMNALELEMLQMLKWNVCVAPEQFEEYRSTVWSDGL